MNVEALAKSETADGEIPVEDKMSNFRESAEQCAEARLLAFRDREWHDNFDNDQWTEEEKSIMNKRGQPIVTSNRLARKMAFLSGMEQQARSDPRAYPTQPRHAAAASVATDVLDHIEVRARFDMVASEAFKNLGIEGIEAVEVVVAKKNRIKAVPVDFDSFFYDPYSRKADFSDATYMGYVRHIHKDRAKRLFPDHKDTIEALASQSASNNLDFQADSGYEDRPYGAWYDVKTQRIMIASMYYMGTDGVWRFTNFTRGVSLRDMVSPYYDEEKEPCCGIIARSLNVSRDNQRFGALRNLIPLQMEKNYRRSLALHLMKNRRMWQARQGVFPNPKLARQQVASADGILLAQGQKDVEWGFVDSTAEMSGNLQLLQEVNAEIDIQGPNAGLQGRGVEGQSGRAILAQQRAGMTEENNLFDAHTEWKVRVYRAMWHRAQQYWTDEMVVRVRDTEQDSGVRFQPINTPPDRAQTLPPEQQGPMLADLDVDIVIEAAPDFITLQHEAFERVSELAEAGMPVPFEIILEMTPEFPGKAKVIRRMREIQEQQQQAQQAAGQIEQAREVSKIEETRARTGKLRTETQVLPLEAAADFAKATLTKS